MVQAAGSKQACAQLQQQLQQQTEAHNGDVSDLKHMTSKVQDLQFDLGNMRQSLQVLPSLLESVSKMPRHFTYITADASLLFPCAATEVQL